ncbi:unnamed protein product, partial [Chrysoparadoxa australica]
VCGLEWFNHQLFGPEVAPVCTEGDIVVVHRGENHGVIITIGARRAHTTSVMVGSVTASASFKSFSLFLLLPVLILSFCLEAFAFFLAFALPSPLPLPLPLALALPLGEPRVPS